MKKKSIFLLAAVACSAALVGGTFASWAVTDNADPFSIKVSTGNVTTDDTEYVTLEWGSQQSMSHVSNLALGTVRKAGVLDLRANTSSNTQTDGTLSYKLTGGSHLLAKLEVKIYQTDVPANNGVIDPEDLDGLTLLDFELDSEDGKYKDVVQVSKNVANPYTVAIQLASSTTPTDVTAMAGEQVTIEFDWGEGTDVVNSRTFYATGFNGVPNAYAWTGNDQNAAFPGVAMKEVVAGSGVYTVEIPSQMQNVIFSYDDDYTNDANRQQSGDLAIATVFTGEKNMFTYDATVTDVHGTISKYDASEVKVPTYYVVGTFSEWGAVEANKMTAVENHAGEYELASITLAAGAKLKVFEKLQNLYYGCATTWDNCGFTLEPNGDLVVTAAGTYRIHFNLNPEGAGNYVDISKLSV